VRPWPVLLAALALAGCGGGDDSPPQGPGVPYPPKAAEPGTAPEPEAEPAGTVVEVGPKPEGVVYDAETGLVAVGVNDPDELVLLDRDGRVRKRVPLPGPPRHLQLAGPGGPVLVPSEPANELVEVSLPGGGTRATPVGRQPHDATAGEDGRLFTADERGSTISEVRDGRRIRTVPVDTQPGGIAAVGDQVAVVAVQAYTVELYDQRTLQGQGARNAGLGPTHVVAGADGRIYVADTRGGEVLVYDTEPRLRVAGRIALPGSPYGLAIDGDRLWVTLTERNELVELRAGAEPKELRRFPTVRQPNSVAVEPGSGRVFVASRADGTLQIIGR
jgi:DNA-binding beta-propeller fold protein YncE